MASPAAVFRSCRLLLLLLVLAPVGRHRRSSVTFRGGPVRNLPPIQFAGIPKRPPAIQIRRPWGAGPRRSPRGGEMCGPRFAGEIPAALSAEGVPVAIEDRRFYSHYGTAIESDAGWFLLISMDTYPLWPFETVGITCPYGIETHFKIDPAPLLRNSRAARTRFRNRRFPFAVLSRNESHVLTSATVRPRLCLLARSENRANPTIRFLTSRKVCFASCYPKQDRIQRFCIKCVRLRKGPPGHEMLVRHTPFSGRGDHGCPMRQRSGGSGKRPRERCDRKCAAPPAKIFGVGDRLSCRAAAQIIT